MIGPAGPGTVPALSQGLTAFIGQRRPTCIPPGRREGHGAGRGLLYTVNVVNDKVAAAKGAANGQFMFPPAVSTATSGATTPATWPATRPSRSTRPTPTPSTPSARPQAKSPSGRAARRASQRLST